MKARIVLVTGDSSGFGLEMVKAFLEQGDRVYGLSRRCFSYPGLVHFRGDVASREDVASALKEIERREGRLDILVNNAGYGIFSAIEETPLEEMRRLYEVNVLGAVLVTQEALPLLRRSSGGKILNVSSIGSEVPLPFQAFYSAAKCSLDTIFDALRSELRPFSISIVSLRPGDSRTAFTRHRRVLASSPLYQERLQRCLRQVERDERGGFPPSRVASKAVRVSLRKNPREVYRIGAKDRFLNFLFHALPRRVRSRIVSSIYAK